jgi:hypothetical protein
MQAATYPNAESLEHLEKKNMLVGVQFPPLEHVTRPAVGTAAAAYYLNRKQQTLRGWACLENGPLRPLRVHGRLAWRVVDLKRVLGVA